MEFKLFMLARVLCVANLLRQGKKVDKIKRGLRDSNPSRPHSFYPPIRISPPGFGTDTIDYIKR